MAQLESAQQGVTNQSASTLINNFSFSIAIGMFIFDIFLYLILANYLERVLPSTYGIRLPWYFCFQPSFWRGEARLAIKAIQITITSYHESHLLCYHVMSSSLSAEEQKILEMQDVAQDPNFEPASEELTRNTAIK